jgi:glucose/arabinose dehydrogenase
VQQGVMDLELDPNFSNNRFYYVFYTAGSPNRDRLSRFTSNTTLTGTIAGSEVVLYEDPQTADAEHHGGAVMFGNDGKLYFTTGEHFNASLAPLLTSPRGKIHRINPDGTVPTDNPFYDGAGPNVDSIWARGLLNPFRAFYDKPTGRLFVGDVGGNVGSSIEELNLGAAGADYGWPNTEGACAAPCVSPIHSYNHNNRDAAITGGFVYHGTQFPAQYQGSYFFADYSQNWIRRLTLDSNGNVTGVFNFEPADGSVDGPYGDIVYLTEGPDGSLYYVDLGFDDQSGQYGISKIRRIRYVEQNQAPIAVGTADQVSGPGFSVTFSSAGSKDPEGQPITFLWTFGDGSTSSEANPVHVYARAGQYTVRLEVSDGVTSTQAPPISVTLGNAPTATILNPTNATPFRAGDVISFTGTGTDIEDGSLPLSAFTWSVDFLHEGHVHPGPRYTGVAGGSLAIPVSGHDFSGNTRYRISLTVTDSDGLQSTTSVVVVPDKVNLTFTTTPPGLTLYLDGIAHPTPFVYDTLIGFSHTIEARTQGSTSFESWSDGGAQLHSITVPGAPQNYVATFISTKPPIPPGAVATWTFDEGSGTQAADSSGNGHGGTLVNGPTWIAGKFGNALQFDGTNDYVDTAVESGFDFTGPFSASLWVKRNGFSKAWEAMLTKGDSTWGIARNGSARTAAFTTFNSSGTAQDLVGSTTIDDNQWHHIVAVSTGTAKQIYVDGVLVASTSYTQTLATNNLNLRIGMNQEFTSAYYGGAVDDVRVYGRALTAAEVTALYSQ